MQIAFNDSDEKTAARVIEAILRDAYFMADITAAFLKAHGYQPSSTAETEKDAVPADPEMVERAKKFLLNLAAALRIALWERAGFRPYLPADIPDSSTAFRNLLPPPKGDDGASSIASDLSLRVFRFRMERLCQNGLATLGTDVLLPTQRVNEDDLLEELADLLWQNRHLASEGASAYEF